MTENVDLKTKALTDRTLLMITVVLVRFTKDAT